MRVLITFCCSFLLIGTVYGQVKNYKAATLLTIDGQLFEGLVNLESDQLMAHGVQFKIAATGEYRQFNNKEIERLEVADPVNLIYENVSFRGLNYMTGVLIKEERLARKLIDDEIVELYRLRLQIQEYPNDLAGFPDYMFYLRKDGDFYPLKTTIGANAENTRFIKKEYRGVLKSLFRDLPDLERKVDNLRFTTKNIIDFVYDYLAFQQPEKNFDLSRIREKKVSIIHGFHIAYTLADLEATLPMNSGYAIGYRYTMKDVFQSNSMEINFGLDYYRQAHGAFENENSFSNGLNTIRIPIAVNLALANGSKFVPYFRGMFTLSYLSMSGGVQQFSLQLTSFGRVIVPAGVAEISINRFSVVPGIGAGVRRDRLRIELMYDRLVIPNLRNFDSDFNPVQPIVNLSIGYDLR